LFNDGNQVMAEGSLERACQAFEASNRGKRRDGINSSWRCRERNQQLAAAWSAYKDALACAVDA
jgi:hypothetical protein